MVITATDEDQANTGDAVLWYSAFYGCTSFTYFPLIDTHSATSFQDTWHDCTNMTSFPLLNTSELLYLYGSWWNCRNLINIPLMDTSKVTTWNNAFYRCYDLLEIPEFDTSAGTNFNGTWQHCTSLTSFPALDFSKALYIVSWNGCTGLTSFPYINPAVAWCVNDAWANCTGLNGYDFPTIHLPKVTTAVNTFQNVTLSTTSYSNLLIDFESVNSETPTTSFNFGNSKYNASAVTARADLISRGWVIYDGGPA